MKNSIIIGNRKDLQVEMFEPESGDPILVVKQLFLHKDGKQLFQKSVLTPCRPFYIDSLRHLIRYWLIGNDPDLEELTNEVVNAYIDIMPEIEEPSPQVSNLN